MIDRALMDTYGTIEPTAEVPAVSPEETPGSVNLQPAELDGILGLMTMSQPQYQLQSQPQPQPSGVEKTVSQLVTNAPETFENATSEAEILQSLQGVIGQRLKALKSNSEPATTN